MTLVLEYEVTEHYPDDAPEPFGYYHHDLAKPLPKTGDVITLRWLDGSEAYPVRVRAVRDTHLDVESTKLTPL